MESSLLNTSVVIIANQHNPTILHDGILRSHGIIEPDYNVITNEQVCTPAFSSVKYDNGISFVVDNARLQIRDDSPNIDIKKSRVDKIAIKYIKNVPLVKYVSIGLNFLNYILYDEPKKYIYDNFLKIQKFEEAELEIINSAVNYQFQIKDYSLNISLKTGNVSLEEYKKEAIIIDANFSVNIQDNSSNDDIVNVIQKYPDRFENLLEILNSIFE